MKGVLISFEGCEGSGKTTQADILEARLKSIGKTVVRTREPGTTLTGEHIREIVQHNKLDEVLEAETETFLFAASRAQMVRLIVRPALDAGHFVISDRYADSMLAYQGYGREQDIELVKAINRFAVGETLPDLTFLLDIDEQVGLDRVQKRNHQVGSVRDSIEREAGDFHARVRAGYLEIARKEPARYHVLDATQAEDVISSNVWRLVEELLKKQARGT